MNGILIIDTTYNGESFSDIKMTGKQILDYLKSNNYNVLPILRIIPSGSYAAALNPIQYLPIIAAEYGNTDGSTLEEIATKRLLYIAGGSDFSDIAIDYDTGKIKPANK